MVKFISLHALDYEHIQYLKNKKTTRSKMRITTLYTFCLFVCLFVLFDSLRPINNFSVRQGRVFLGGTSTKLGIMCLAQGHNAVTPVRLEPTLYTKRIHVTLATADRRRCSVRYQLCSDIVYSTEV